MAKVTVRWNATSGHWLECESEGVKDAIKVMSQYLEVFGVNECGKCQSKAIVCSHNQDRKATTTTSCGVRRAGPCSTSAN